MAQVPVICIEQHALKVYARYMVDTKTRRNTLDHWAWRMLFRFFGHIWVVSWLLYSGWRFLDVYFRVGMASWEMPFPVLGLLFWKPRN